MEQRRRVGQQVLPGADAQRRSPHTLASLIQDLEALGVRDGQVLLVHSSMRALGRTHGGPATVISALCAVLGSRGTLVVPTMTPENSDTSSSHLAAIAGMSPSQVRDHLATKPAFDPAATPARSMGVIAEHVRTTPGAIRSEHPQASFAALGPLANELMMGHAPDCHFGEASPLARLYQHGAWILLLGVAYEACTAFHLAEYRYHENPPERTYRCVVSLEGKPVWWEYWDVDLDDREMESFGEHYDRIGAVTFGYVGDARCRLIPLTSVVDVATRWLQISRN